jgi:hypothetical protein
MGRAAPPARGAVAHPTHAIASTTDTLSFIDTLASSHVVATIITRPRARRDAVGEAAGPRLNSRATSFKVCACGEGAARMPNESRFLPWRR